MSFSERQPVFTTFRVENGKVLYLDYHIARLEGWCRELSLPFDACQTDSAAQQFFSESGSGRGRIIIGIEGASPQYTFDPGSKPPPFIFGTILRINRPWGRFKTWPPRTLERKPGEELLLVCHDTGFVLEGSVTNIFARYNGRWLTPPDDGSIVAGLGRKHFIEELAAKGEEVSQEHFTVAVLLQSEIFLTNSLRGTHLLASVEHIDNTDK